MCERTDIEWNLLIQETQWLFNVSHRLCFIMVLIVDHQFIARVTHSTRVALVWRPSRLPPNSPPVTGACNAELAANALRLIKTATVFIRVTTHPKSNNMIRITAWKTPVNHHHAGVVGLMLSVYGRHSYAGFLKS